MGHRDNAGNLRRRSARTAYGGARDAESRHRRHWQLAQGQRTINNYENRPLGQLKCAGGYFEGQSTAGVPVRLTR
jgi:hypothetical protein